jgi:hypothetical protein
MSGKNQQEEQFEEEQSGEEQSGEEQSGEEHSEEEYSEEEQFEEEQFEEEQFEEEQPENTGVNAGFKNELLDSCNENSAFFPIDSNTSTKAISPKRDDQNAQMEAFLLCKIKAKKQVDIEIAALAKQIEALEADLTDKKRQADGFRLILFKEDANVGEKASPLNKSSKPSKSICKYGINCNSYIQWKNSGGSESGQPMMCKFKHTNQHQFSKASPRTHGEKHTNQGSFHTKTPKTQGEKQSNQYCKFGEKCKRNGCCFQH